MKYVILALLIACSDPGIGNITATPVPGTTGFPQTCSVSTVAGGVLITCPDGTSATLLNGVNGLPGADSPPTPLTPIAAVEPCGQASSAYKEVLLILENGDIFSSFSDSLNGANTRNTFLPDGNYIDTDDSGCQFSVSTNGSTRSIVWGSGGYTFQVSQ